MIRPGLAITLLCTLCLAVAAVTPPLQAPDEIRHVYRGHHVSQGELVPASDADGRRGGPTDTGIIALADIWRPLIGKGDVRATPERWSASQSVQWTGDTAWQSFTTQESGPLIYAPIAAGLRLGQLAVLSPLEAYYLARASVIALNCCLIWCAFRLCPPTPLVAATVLLPMAVFQMSCAVIDGTSLSCAAVACAAFVRFTRDRERAVPWLLPIMALAALVSVSGRPHGAPLLALVPLTCLYTRRTSSLWVGATLPILVFGWMAHSMDTRLALGDASTDKPRTVQAIVSDWRQAGPAIEAVSTTVSSWKWIVGQFKMWVGDLGSLDTPLGGDAYITMALLLAAAAACSVQWRPLRKTPASAVILLACGVASAVVVVLALQMFYNAPSSTRVFGIQGRYFLVPSLMLAYSTVAGPTERFRWQARSATPLVIAIFTVSLLATLNALLRRYYGIGIG